MGFIQDFKDFAFKGNLIDMAVGIIMGGAVGAIVQSFLKNIITPVISMVAGVPDLSALKHPIGKMLPKKDEAGAIIRDAQGNDVMEHCLLYTSPSPRDRQKSRMPSSA